MTSSGPSGRRRGGCILLSVLCVFNACPGSHGASAPPWRKRPSPGVVPAPTSHSMTSVCSESSRHVSPGCGIGASGGNLRLACTPTLVLFCRADVLGGDLAWDELFGAEQVFFLAGTWAAGQRLLGAVITDEASVSGGPLDAAGSLMEGLSFTGLRFAGTVSQRALEGTGVTRGPCWDGVAVYGKVYNSRHSGPVGLAVSVAPCHRMSCVPTTFAASGP